MESNQTGGERLSFPSPTLDRNCNAEAADNGRPARQSRAEPRSYFILVVDFLFEQLSDDPKVDKPT